jgi:hypothetical protein
VAAFPSLSGVMTSIRGEPSWKRLSSWGGAARLVIGIEPFGLCEATGHGRKFSIWALLSLRSKDKFLSKYILDVNFLVLLVLSKQ